MTFLYVDTETLGLDLLTHDVWELGWAIEDDPIQSGFIEHEPDIFEPEALKVNKYMDRFDGAVDNTVEYNLLDALHDYRDRGDALVLVGANPAFDAIRLSRRWDWQQPWHYRMIDLSTYVMPWRMSLVPLGLNQIANALRTAGYAVPVPDHTAAGDVATVRACHKALMLAYEGVQ